MQSELSFITQTPPDNLGMMEGRKRKKDDVEHSVCCSAAPPKRVKIAEPDIESLAAGIENLQARVVSSISPRTFCKPESSSVNTPTPNSGYHNSTHNNNNNNSYTSSPIFNTKVQISEDTHTEAVSNNDHDAMDVEIEHQDGVAHQSTQTDTHVMNPHILDIAHIDPSDSENCFNMIPVELWIKIAKYLPNSSFWSLAGCNHSLREAMLISLEKFKMTSEPPKDDDLELDPPLGIRLFKSTKYLTQLELEGIELTDALIDCIPEGLTVLKLTQIGGSIKLSKLAPKLLTLQVLEMNGARLIRMFISIISSQSLADGIFVSPQPRNSPQSNSLFPSLTSLEVSPLLPTDLSRMLNCIPTLNRLQANLVDDKKSSNSATPGAFASGIKLRHLTLDRMYSNSPFPHTFVATLSQLTHLEYLSISTGVDDNNFERLCAGLTNLEHLHITSAGNLTDFQYLPKLTKLKNLHIDFGVNGYRMVQLNCSRLKIAILALPELEKLEIIFPKRNAELTNLRDDLKNKAKKLKSIDLWPIQQRS